MKKKNKGKILKHILITLTAGIALWSQSFSWANNNIFTLLPISITTPPINDFNLQFNQPLTFALALNHDNNSRNIYIPVEKVGAPLGIIFDSIKPTTSSVGLDKNEAKKFVNSLTCEREISFLNESHLSTNIVGTFRQDGTPIDTRVTILEGRATIPFSDLCFGLAEYFAVPHYTYFAIKLTLDPVPQCFPGLNVISVTFTFPPFIERALGSFKYTFSGLQCPAS